MYYLPTAANKCLAHSQICIVVVVVWALQKKVDNFVQFTVRQSYNEGSWEQILFSQLFIQLLMEEINFSELHFILKLHFLRQIWVNMLSAI